MMHTYRIFIQDPTMLSASKLTLPPDKVHHLLHVLKLMPMDVLDIVTPTHIVSVTIQKITPSFIEFDRCHTTDIPQRPYPAITIFQACPKQDKMTDILRSCTEIGVQKFVPIYTEKSLCEISAHKQSRWESVLVSAAEQSKQMGIPILEPAYNLHDLGHFLSKHSFDHLLVCWELELTLTLKQSLQVFRQKNLTSTLPTIGILVGPEGGLTQQDRRLCQKWGFVSVSLGPGILRVEHAAFYACSHVLYEWSL